MSFLYELGFEESTDGEFYEVKDVNVDVIAKFRYALNRISELKSQEIGPDRKRQSFLVSALESRPCSILGKLKVIKDRRFRQREPMYLNIRCFSDS